MLLKPSRNTRRLLGAACALTVATAFAGATPLRAQDYTQYHTVKNADKFAIKWAEFYAWGNKATEETRAQLPHHLNIAYGEDAKQQLDIYLPKEPVKNAPVLLFLHGGGFREGDRLHYGYIAAPFAKHGIITAVASYRLTTSGVSFPAPADDAKAALIWLHKNVAQYGGDANALYISGHSAGAILSGSVGGNREWLKEAGISPDALKGMITISGIYDVEKVDDLDDYAPTPELKDQASAIRHVSNPAPKAIVAYGTNEPPFRDPSIAFAEKLKEAGIEVQLIALEGQNHKDTVVSFADEKSPLFKAAIEMIKPAQ